MRKMAATRARRLWEKTDHWQMAKDLQQEGWLAYISHAKAGEGARWLYVRRAMNDYWCKWMFGYQYKSAKIDNFNRPLPYEYGLDVTPLFQLGRVKQMREYD